MKRNAFLCSYPKSGRTWLRFVLAHAINRHYELGLSINFHTLFTVVPNMGPGRLRGTPAYAFYHRPDVPLIIADHSPFQARFERRPVILLLRTTSDILVSYYFHVTRRMCAYSGSLSEFVRDPSWGIRPFIQYLNSWSTVLDSLTCHVLTYEQMHSDAAASAAGVLDFLALDVSRGDLNAAVEAATFERMRETEIRDGFPGRQMQLEAAALRARKGQVGAHTSYLTDDDCEYIRDSCVQGFTPQSVHLLEQNGIPV